VFRLFWSRRLKHRWEALPGPIWFSATQIYKRQVERARNRSVFVEVGAWKGRSALFMAVEIANSGKKIEFYSVDHWLGSDETAHDGDEDVTAGRLYETFLANIEPVKNYVRPIRGHSVDVARQFPDGSLDFIYLDAGHTYLDLKADLEAWWPKLKANCDIAGDDWCFDDEKRNELGVQRAVKEFFSARGEAITVEPGQPNPEWLQWVVTKRVHGSEPQRLSFNSY